MNVNMPNASVQRALLWTGPAVIAALAVGMVVFAGFLPPPSPTDTAEVIAQRFRDGTTGIRIGCSIMIIIYGLWSPWAGVLIAWVRRMESGFPVLTYGAVACAGAGTVLFLITPLTWVVAAFRPDTYAPETIQVLNDWAWVSLLYTFSPFAVLFVLVAIAILTERRERATLPRWVAYYNIAAALMMLPFTLIVFFKDGPFAWNGVFGFYLPVSSFCVWVGIMTWSLLKAIRLEESIEQPASALV